MARSLRTLLLVAVTFLVLAGTAEARGGNYVFASGTPAEQGQVTAALDASAFDWSLVPQQITVHIAPGVDSEATLGQIWLDSDLLHAGQFSWGVVQHEYAHQVDFFLLNPAMRASLLAKLGGSDWCHGIAGLPHASYGCERFASTLTWAYWPSAANSMRPQSAQDESAGMKPAAFRALMTSMIGAPVTQLRR